MLVWGGSQPDNDIYLFECTLYMNMFVKSIKNINNGIAYHDMSSLFCILYTISFYMFSKTENHKML